MQRDETIQIKLITTHQGETAEVGKEEQQEGGEGSRGELNDQKGLSAFRLFSYLKDEGWGQISDTLTGLLPLFQHH